MDSHLQAYSFCLVITGIGIGMSASWELALLMFGMFPFLIASGAYIAKVIGGNETIQNEAFEDAGGLAQDAFGAIR